jgi:hypothetical protein
MKPYRVVPFKVSEHVRPVSESVFVVLPAVSVNVAVAGAQLTEKLLLSRVRENVFADDHVVLRVRLKVPFAKVMPRATLPDAVAEPDAKLVPVPETAASSMRSPWP